MTLRKTALTIALALTIIFALATTASACESRTSRWCGKKHSASYNKLVIREVARLRGLSQADTKRLLWLAKRESHYHNTSTNGPCKGMFQINTHKAKSRWANPYWNTNRAINYIKKRYHTPRRAVMHSRRYGWY